MLNFIPLSSISGTSLPNFELFRGSVQSGTVKMAWLSPHLANAVVL